MPFLRKKLSLFGIFDEKDDCKIINYLLLVAQVFIAKSFKSQDQINFLK